MDFSNLELVSGSFCPANGLMQELVTMFDPQSPGLHHDRGDHRIEFIFFFYFSVTQLAAAMLDSIDRNMKKGKK